MTARPDATPEPGDEQTRARPDHGQAEDGKGGGAVHEGKPGASQFGTAPDDASDRNAPGLATSKKADRRE